MSTFSSFLASTSGNDTFYGQAGNDTIDGGSGLDTVIYAGDSSGYRITRSGNAWVVTDTDVSNGNDGRDVLRNVENIRFANGSLSVQNQQRVNTSTVGNQHGSSVSALADGGYLVAWLSGNSPSVVQVHAQRYDAAGQKVGSELNVGSGSGSSTPTSTDVVGLKGGGFALLHNADSFPAGAASLKVFDVNGSLVKTIDYGFNPLSHRVNKASIKTTDDGGFVMVYHTTVTTPVPGSWIPNTTRTFFVQKFDALGVAQGGPKNVGTYTADDVQFGADIQAFASGFYVTWVELVSRQFVLRVSKLRPDGTLLSSQVLDTNTSPIQNAKFTALGNGEFVLSWKKSAFSPFYAKRYDAFGNVQGDAFLVSETTLPGYAQHVLAGAGGNLTTLNNGDVVLTQSITANGDADVYTERYSSTGSPVGRFVLTGTAGADVLNASLDYLAAGGAGDDTYIVRNAAAQILESGNQGIDTVQAYTSYTLGENLENLVLMGSATSGTGNALNNLITGNDRSNVIDGAAGADTLAGGKGNDTYHVDNAGDVVLENEEEGRDTVVLSSALLNYTLGANLENLNVGSSTSAFALSGNELNNAITGGGGKDTLVGGAGNDTLNGGEGVDSVVYTGNSSGYRIARSGDAWVVTDTDATNGSDGRDVLRNVENIQFGNGSLSVQSQPQRVNTTTVGGQFGSSVSALANGGHVVAWISSEFTGSYAKAQRFDASGQKVGSELVVGYPAGTSGFSYSSDVIGLTGGGFAVLWKSSSIYPGGLRVFDADGNTKAFFQAFGSRGETVKALDDGGFVMAYHTIQSVSFPNPGSKRSYFVQKFNALGQADGSAKTVAVFAPPFQGGEAVSDADVQTFASGSCITWVERVSNQYAVKVSKLSTDGAVISTQIADTSSNAIENVKFTALANGEFVLAWNKGGVYFAKRYDATGAAQGEAFVVSESTLPGYAMHILSGLGGNLTTLNNGDVVLTKSITDTSGMDVFMERYDAMGTPIGPFVLTGTEGADLLNASLDYLAAGGAGDDTYVVRHAAAQIAEKSNQGTDTVQAYSNYAIGENLENLVLLGSANNGTGNALNNVITGNNRHNVLDGAAGADTMAGGKGNDTYHVDNAGDVVLENKGEGRDTVYSTAASYTLAANVENLVLVSSGNSQTGIGNSLNNVITAGVHGGLLDGGAGRDTLIGSAGADVFVVDNAGDVVIHDTPDDYVDFVDSSISYVLGANIEVLTLIGTSNINGTGNELDNFIYGNAGNNVLDGGAGSDFLMGGAGDDTYYINEDDQFAEYEADGGTDTVFSSAHFTFMQGNVELLYLTGVENQFAFGSDSDELMHANDASSYIDCRGGNDTAIGGSGWDTLRCGTGWDVLTGGAGSDRFEVDISFQLGVDLVTITDFSVSEGDIIGVSTSSFLALEGVYDLSERFRLSDQAVVGGDDFIVYNASTGELFYDATGSSTETGSMQLWAVLSNQTQDLTWESFQII